jgi:hypothetical protein
MNVIAIASGTIHETERRRSAVAIDLGRAIESVSESRNQKR